MKYFKLITLMTSFFVVTSNCWAMDAPLEKENIHRLSTINEMYKHLGEDDISETASKKARVEATSADLRKHLVVLDFDECLGFATTNEFGSEFAQNCRLFSCEMYRLDRLAFQNAAEKLKISVKQFEQTRDVWMTEYLQESIKYDLLEPETATLLRNLRRRGAKLIICSGNPNTEGRKLFLQSLGFDGEKDYFCEREDKTRPIKECLASAPYSTVIFIDNREQTVKDFVKKLSEDLKGGNSPVEEIIGLHYDIFHQTVNSALLVNQFTRIKDYLAEKQRKVEEDIHGKEGGVDPRLADLGL